MPTRRHPWDHDDTLVRAQAHLSPRLLKIFLLAREGRTATQIASELGVSRSTVRAQLQDIVRRIADA